MRKLFGMEDPSSRSKAGSSGNSAGGMFDVNAFKKRLLDLKERAAALGSITSKKSKKKAKKMLKAMEEQLKQQFEAMKSVKGKSGLKKLRKRVGEVEAKRNEFMQALGMKEHRTTNIFDREGEETGIKQVAPAVGALRTGF